MVNHEWNLVAVSYYRSMLFPLSLLLLACSPGQEPVVTEANPAPVVESATETAAQSATQVDPDSGLIMGDNWQLVKGHCSACHSAQLVTQNRGNRQAWLEIIRWMQETQGLWQFDEQTEAAILDYLARNYAPAAGGRRAPLNPALLPLNPYSTES